MVTAVSVPDTVYKIPREVILSYNRCFTFNTFYHALDELQLTWTSLIIPRQVWVFKFIEELFSITLILLGHHSPQCTVWERCILLSSSLSKKRVGNYLIGKSIGEGAFAKVKEGLHVITGEKVISWSLNIMLLSNCRIANYYIIILWLLIAFSLGRSFIFISNR